MCTFSICQIILIVPMGVIMWTRASAQSLKTMLLDINQRMDIITSSLSSCNNYHTQHNQGLLWSVTVPFPSLPFFSFILPNTITMEYILRLPLFY